MFKDVNHENNKEGKESVDITNLMEPEDSHWLKGYVYQNFGQNYMRGPC